MSAVGFSTESARRLFPAGVSGWSGHVWGALAVGIIAVGVTSWIAYRKRRFDGSKPEGRCHLSTEVLLQVVILAGAVFVSYWNGAHQDPFTVNGPNYPIVAQVGEDVVLNCTVGSHRQDVSLEIEWRNLESGAAILTCGDDREGSCQSHGGRAHFFEEQLAVGNVSIKLEGVRGSDAGRYRCSVSSKSHSSDVVMELSIVALGTKPGLSITQLDESSILYKCQSEGWFPEPGIIWKDSDGKSLIPLSKITMATDEQGLYNVDIQYQATLAAAPTVTCIIHNRLNNVKKVSTAQIADFPPHVQFRVSEAEWSRIHGHSVSLTLDADTANPWLVLSEGWTSVSDSNAHQQVADNGERFLVSHCVLAAAGFASGRHYWEVEVGRKAAWDLGLAAEFASRRGKVGGGPGAGHWCLSHPSETEYQAADTPPMALVLGESPAAVGVYLDYERGWVAFFDPARRLHLYTFVAQFSERLYPMFCPGLYDWQKNNEPLRLRNPIL
uniref:butyrophilin subfamily 1 member A1-like n=1 Tax=Pristiophorus japonicus TaxID=55135 RepID=UPI00398E4831